MVARKHVFILALVALLVGVFSEALRTTEEEMATTFGKTLANHVAKRGE
ncbi:MAG: hypothetical protein V2A79_09680 [Planctomycetota bacterium]